jgi:hypothetical protein
MQKNLFIFFLLFSVALAAQNNTAKKELIAQKTSTPPKIDGVLDDLVWDETPVAKDFVQLNPGDGTPENNTHRTEVKLAYDNEAIYIAAYLYDNAADGILKQFSQRDNVDVQSDWFIVSFNPFNDGINETKFVVTAAGTLADAKSVNGEDDYSWSTVFAAQVSQSEKGWFAEFKIPYAALRFAKQQNPTWGLQFYREIKSENQTLSWNYINKAIGNESQFAGVLKGLDNLEPPTRLTFFPFSTAILDRYDNETTTDLKFGLDVKYGINDSFTLDATLIPDFSQTAFDNVTLNLGPFEQTFSENRQFFTEGTELFSKGDIFFSRRIGNASSTSPDLNTDEVVVNEPDEVNLLNALKLSGRTNSGFGIGVLNAITEETTARVYDTIANIGRNVVTEPLANYNVLVFDKQFNKNSSVALINTNVLRDGRFRDANVTALNFDIANKSNSYKLSGQGTSSNVKDTDGKLTTGFSSNLAIEKIKGRFRYGAAHDLANTKYDINDLGLNVRNNFNNFNLFTSFESFEPTNYFNKYRIEMSFEHQRLYAPNVQTGNRYRLEFFGLNKNRFAFGSSLSFRAEQKDYFEARTDGAFFLVNPTLGGNMWISTDYRKKFAADVRIGARTWFDYNQVNDAQRGIFIRTSPRYRFSNKFLMIYSFQTFIGNDRLGFATFDDNDNPIFGRRDQQNIENKITASYNFSSTKAINLSFRNFWSVVHYKDNVFYDLQSNGQLIENDTFAITEDNDPNRNFNVWNLDLSFNWRFAPGSEAILLYRNSLFNQDSLAQLNFSESFDNLFKQPIQNTLSLRIVYFLDYNTIKQVLKRKSKDS